MSLSSSWLKWWRHKSYGLSQNFFFAFFSSLEKEILNYSNHSSDHFPFLWKANKLSVSIKILTCIISVRLRVRKQLECLKSRVRPRFFDQVGHETMNASSGNEHFFKILSSSDLPKLWTEPTKIWHNFRK